MHLSNKIQPRGEFVERRTFIETAGTEGGLILRITKTNT
jgi:hypothetical protein